MYVMSDAMILRCSNLPERVRERDFKHDVIMSVRKLLSILMCRHHAVGEEEKLKIILTLF